MVLQLLWIGVTGSNESQDYAFLHYIEVNCPQNNVNEILGSDSKRWCTNNEVKHSLRRSTGPLKRGGLSERERFGVELLKTVKGSANEVRDSHAIAPPIERNLWSFYLFYLNRCYSDV